MFYGNYRFTMLQLLSPTKWFFIQCNPNLPKYIDFLRLPNYFDFLNYPKHAL